MCFINCSWTKFIAIIVNVCPFYAKFLLDRFDFLSDFDALDVLRFAWSEILSQSQFQAAELNWRQLDTKSQMKSAPKLVQFFTLSLNSGICSPLWLFEAHYWTSYSHLDFPDWNRLQLIRAPTSRSRAIFPTIISYVLLFFM